MTSSNVYLFGSNHISKSVAQDIERAIQTYKPDLICIELDEHRLESLRKKTPQKLTSYLKLGLFTGVFLYLVSYVQRSIAKKHNTQPGIDMLSALRLANEHKIPVALIDQPIHITTLRLKKVLGFRFFIKLFVDTIRGIFLPKRRLPMWNITTVPPPHIVAQLLQYVKESYPQLYHELVERRNTHMCHVLNHLCKNHTSILVIVGAAHVEGMSEICTKEFKEHMQVSRV